MQVPASDPPSSPPDEPPSTSAPPADPPVPAPPVPVVTMLPPDPAVDPPVPNVPPEPVCPDEAPVELWPPVSATNPPEPKIMVSGAASLAGCCFFPSASLWPQPTVTGKKSASPKLKRMKFSELGTHEKRTSARLALQAAGKLERQGARA